MGDRQAEKYYDRLSSKYDKQHTSGYFEFLNRFEFNALAPLASKKKVLEVGCGTGIMLERISKIAASAVGVDISDEMLAASRKRGLKVKKASAASLPFGQGEFDLAYAVKVIAHVPNAGKAILEMSRVAKENGFVALEFYNSRSLKRLLKAVFPVKTFTKYHSLNEMKSLLPASFKIVEVRGAMVFAPSRILFDLPLVHYLFAGLESIAGRTFLKRFASHILIVCKKKPNARRSKPV